MTTTPYADKLRDLGLIVCDHGARAAELAGRFYGGLHNFPDGERALRRVDWGNPYAIHWRQQDSLASSEGDGLTRLVFLAHDLGIRVGVRPSMRSLEIQCHPRGTVTTSSHPTIEAALADWRTRNPAR